MKFQTIISIVVLATLFANAQGLLVKSAIKKSIAALPSIVSSIGSLSSPLGGEIEAVAATDTEDAAVRYVGQISSIPVAVPATVYTYAPYYASPVYYRAVRPVARRTTYIRASSSGGLKGALGGLLAGSARTIGTLGSGIKGAIGNALSSVQPAGAEVYVSSF